MSETSRLVQQPLAILGMACRLPGADNLDQYWRLLIEGRSAVAELPADRLDQSLYYDPRVGVRGKTYSKLGAILSSRQFDRRACPISPALAASVDNAHLLMCETAAAALRHAGLDPFNLPLRNTGVYIGHAQGSNLGGDYTYATLIEEAAHFLEEVDEFRQLPAADQRATIEELVRRVRAQLPQRTPETPDVAANLIAGTISKAFDLTGPFVAVNSACASSLQAILAGARALQLGRIEMAIVGGASDCKSDSLVLFAHAQAMSASGSRPFDAQADGLICSEGYAALVLKTLARAEADGDAILAVIRGLGVASDGKGKSLWAPRKEGQIEAMRRAYRGGLDMSRLEYVECHATATQLGDATELGTLAEALRPVLPPGKRIPIASVKANLGHSLETAGVASLVKVVLAMQHGVVPPAINVRQLNPKIDWNDVPYFVPTAPAPWPAPADGHPRRGAVNAFGIGGLNMHVVVDQYTPAARAHFAAPAPPSIAGDAVAVIGRGCILPGAMNLPEFWRLLTTGADPKRDVPEGRWRSDLWHEPGSRRPYRSPTRRGGFVCGFQYDWRVHKVPPKQIAEADPLQFMLLEAADQALREAGYDRRPFERARVGVIVGTEFGGDFSFQLQLGLRLPHLARIVGQILRERNVTAGQCDAIFQKFSAVLLKHWPALVDETGSFSTSSLASRISKTWDLMGGAAAIDAGGSSSLAALAMAVDQLLAGDVDLMLCAAGQRRMGLPAYEALAFGGLLAADGSPLSRFDDAAHGQVPGEGVGVVLLKRLSDAQRDGDRVLAVIRGVSAAHSEAPGEALAIAAERALRIAAVDPADVSLVEAEGPALAEHRDGELAALARIHGARPRRQPLAVGSASAQIGHLDGAAGMAALLKASLEIEHGLVPAEAALSRPCAALAEAAPALRAPLAPTAVDGASADGRRIAAVSTVSRGLAYQAILEYPIKSPPAAPAVPRQSSAPRAWRTLRFGARSPGELGLAVREAAADAAELWNRADERPFAPADRARLAVVADSPASLAEKLAVAAPRAGDPAALAAMEDQNIFFRQLPPARPRLALVFSGQGSQYTGMLSELVGQSPAAAEALAAADAALGARGWGSFAELAWEPSGRLGSDIWNTQAALLLADHVLYAALANLGVRPDLVFGHSYGEYAALLAAQTWDLATALAVTKARCDGILACPAARGGMLATSAEPDAIERLARLSGLPVYLANHNAVGQSVVAGAVGDLKRFAERLKAEGLSSQLLAVPCPFHSPLMAGAVGPLRQILETAPLRAPRVPLVSVVTNDRVTSAESIRANLVAHMTTPVRYLELVERVAGEQPTVLMEVGPQQVLTRLNRRIVAGRAECLSSDDSQHRGAEQLLRARAVLDCLGLLDGPVPTAPAVSAPAAPVRAGQEILQFDATERRREKMRRQATTAAEPADDDAAPPPPASPPLAAEPAAAAPVVDAPPAPAIEAKPAAPAATASAAELEKFLIQFVVEQTGYPPEVVELDADLEADLGIDSIKKAQLFGELQEYFDVTPTDNLTLDDFPTLRHVLNFLTGTSVKGELPASKEQGGERTAAPPEPALAAPSSAPAIEAKSAAPAAAAKSAELEKFLIQFVVEQTGYPPEVVELDADLEADLGIDSIKKAQLFGELQEYFDVTPTDNLTLDDFPTLRHVLNFLTAAAVQETLPSGEPASEPVEPPDEIWPQAAVGEPHGAVAAVAEPRLAPSRTDVAEPLRLAGSARELGAGLGRNRSAQLLRVLRRHADLGGATQCEAQEPDWLAAPEQKFAAEELEELRGMADGAQVPLGNLLALNLGVLADAGSAARAVVRPAAAGDAALLAVEVERPLSGALAACLEPIATLRTPADGLPHLAVTFAGGAAALAGVNAQRVAAICQPGEPGSARAAARVVGAVLRSAGDLASAVELARSIGGDSPWQVTLSQPGGGAANVHFDTRQHRVLPVAPQQADGAASQPGPWSPAALDELFSRAGAGSPTDPQATVAIEPDGSSMWVKLAGPHGAGRWQRWDLDQFLPPRTSPPQAAPRPIRQGAPLDIGPEDAANGFGHRFAMRMLDRPLPADAPTRVKWTGAALVVGDNPSATALRRRLAAEGAQVVDLPWTDDLDATLAAFDELWRRGPIRHLFLMTARDAAPATLDEADWQRRRERSLLLPMFLCQRWLVRLGEADMLAGSSLLAATALGGDFGFSGQMPCPEGGAVTGLVKAIYLEYVVMRQLRGALTSKTVDAPLDEPADALAEFLLRELAADTIDYEVALVGGQRRLQTAIHRPAAPSARAAIRPDSVWVVTGGARGITAQCARQLGRRFGARLHLLGTSPHRPIDPAWRALDEAGLKDLKAQVTLEASRNGQKPAAAWEAVQKAIEIDRTLAQLAAEGIAASYHVCDVADRAALARTLAAIRAADGPIAGILHGAGIDRSCRLEKKQRGDVLATLGAKVDGAWNLMTLTAADPLRHFIGFGSISGRLGSNGQTDYCLASEMLCKLLTWFGRRRPDCRTIAFHWHPWDEVGMAYRPQTRATFQMTNAPALMPKRDAIEHFVRELYGDDGEHEVLITNWDYYGRFYGPGPAAADVLPADRDERAASPIAARHLVRLVDAPLGRAERTEPGRGGVLILGDNPAARALEERLLAEGVAAGIIEVTDSLPAALARFDQAWQALPGAALVVMTAHDAQPGSVWDRAAWRQRRARGVDAPLLVVQRWLKALAALPERGRATLAAAVNLGGQFGLAGPVPAQEGGALAGLLKSLYVEDTRQPVSRLRVKAIDSPPEEPTAVLAEAIARELATNDPAIEVAWSGSRRRVVRTAPAEAAPAPAATAPAGVWIVTGGARGITAATALALGRRFGLTLHLVGKSPAPRGDSPWRGASQEQLKTLKATIVRDAVAAGRSPEEDWKRVKNDLEIQANLDKFAAAGVRASYHSCDVADWDALAEVLDSVRRTSGPITGILHGAGFAKSGRFETKDPRHVAETLAGKADGAVAILTLTQGDPVRHVIGFGSISGRYGGNGLADYAAANDLLAKILDAWRQRRPDCAATCLHWQTWDEIGMATISDSVGITRNNFQMRFLSPAEGIAHVERELGLGLPEREVVVTDGFFQRTFYPHEPALQPADATAAPQRTGRPLVDSVEPDAEGGLTARITFDPQGDPFLAHHRLRDKPFLPGAAAIEAIAQAASLVAPRRVVAAVCDVEIVNGLAFHTDEPIEAAVRVAPRGDRFDCVLSNQQRDRKGRLIDARRLCTRAAVELADRASTVEAAPPGEPPQGWWENRYPEAALLVHGPPLRLLKQCAYQYDGGWGRVIVPPKDELAGRRGSEGWIVPVAVLDACVVACGSWVFLQFGGRLEVPHSFARLALAGAPRPAERCTLRFFFRGRDDRHSRFDFTLFGDDQRVLLDARDYRTVLLAERT